VKIATSSNAEVKNEWSYISTPPYTCLHGVYMINFTFTFTFKFQESVTDLIFWHLLSSSNNTLFILCLLQTGLSLARTL
jgi:hypothetical protein